MKAEETYFDEISQDGLDRTDMKPHDKNDRLKVEVKVTGKHSKRVLEVMEALDEVADEVTRDYDADSSINDICECGVNHASDEFEENQDD